MIRICGPVVPNPRLTYRFELPILNNPARHMIDSLAGAMITSTNVRAICPGWKPIDLEERRDMCAFDKR